MPPKFIHLNSYSADSINDTTGVYRFGSKFLDPTMIDNQTLSVKSVLFNTSYLNATKWCNTVSVKITSTGYVLKFDIAASTTPYTAAGYVIAFNVAASAAITAAGTAATGMTLVLAHIGAAFTIQSNVAYRISSSDTTIPMTSMGLSYLLDTNLTTSLYTGYNVKTLDQMPPFYIVISDRDDFRVRSAVDLLRLQDSVCVSLVQSVCGAVDPAKGFTSVSLCDEQVSPLRFKRSTTAFFLSFVDSVTFRPVEFTDPVSITLKIG